MDAEDMTIYRRSPSSAPPVRSLLLSLLSICLALWALAPGVGAQDQPVVTQIDVVGAKKVEEATVRFKLKIRVGDPYSPETVREDIKSLYSLGYFEDIVVNADIFEGGLKLIFVLQEKPSIQSIKIVGNKKLTEEKIRGKIDLVEGSIIPPGALLKNADKIRLFYEEEGYYRAQITSREERLSPTEVSVSFTIVEGDKYDVNEIRIVGNKYLKEKDIKSKLQTTELFLWFFGGTLKREELRRDLDRIRAYYLDNGFLDIAVAEPEIEIDAAKKRLVITIRVEEGPEYRISKLTIGGNKLFPEGEIRRLMTSMPGGIFSRERLQADVVAITDRYSEHGYLFADVAPVTDVQRSDTTVGVSLEITEGQQAFINRIEIAGNTRTRDKVIRREIPMVEGDVFNSALLRVSRQNLVSLGYFDDSLKIETRRVTAPDKVDLVVDVKEKSTGAFTLGGGFSSVDGAIGVATISQANLFGYGKRLSVAAQIGQNANRGNVEYVDPHFLDSNFMLNGRLFLTQTNYQSNQGFNADTYGTAVAFGHSLFELVYGTAGYLLENVKIKDLTADAPDIIKQQALENGGEAVTSSLTLTLTRDSRDNFAEPTRGNRTALNATYAGGFLGFDNNFYKFSADVSQYWPLWWKLVGHVRGSVLYGDSFGTTPNLPAQERFFLGSINTIRGFRNFTISPKDPKTDGLTGGNKAWFTNTEILFPLYEQLRMRGLVFFDIGNNLDESSSFVDLFSTRMYRAVGVGLRFMSPLGAIRVEWGFNLSPKPGEKSQVLGFTAGTAF
jgi:outer membrane protein insertion porin family